MIRAHLSELVILNFLQVQRREGFIFREVDNSHCQEPLVSKDYYYVFAGLYQKRKTLFFSFLKANFTL